MADELTLFDVREKAGWWHALGLSEADLRNVRLHERQNPDQDFLPLPDVTGPEGRPLYAYREGMPPEIWSKLSGYLGRQGEPSGYEKRGLFSGSQKQMTDYERERGEEL